MNNNSAVLLKKIYISSKTSLDALSAVAKRSNSFDFESFLNRQQYKYFDIAEDANMQLRIMRQLPDEDIWSRLGFLATLKLETIGNRTQNRLAEILIEGCMGGVNEMIREVNSSKEIAPECLDLAHILIETEQETIAILQRFL